MAGSRKFCQFFMALVKKVVFFFRFYLDLFIDKLFGFYYDSKALRVPAPTNHLVLQSACSLAKKIRTQQITSEETVRAFIERIKQVNSLINAVVDTRFEDALKEAKQIDLDIASGFVSGNDFRLKPFLGVPFTMKESTGVAGLSSTFGMVKRKGKKAFYDADCVKRIKDAGGICVGVTNIPLLNMWQETSNKVFGLTKNPFNTSRNVGGSSGGESSIIASCGSPFGIGTDIGGSIRIPAFMCGVFGHKTSSHLIPTKGLTYRTGEERTTMLSVGPMTKFSEDLLPLLQVLVGPENSEKLKLHDKVDVKNIKVFYIEDPEDLLISPARQDMKDCFRKVINNFENPQKLRFKGTQLTGRLWNYWMSKEDNYNFALDLTDKEQEASLWQELIKFVFGQSALTLASLFVLINNKLPKAKSSWAEEQTRILQKQFIDKLGDEGVLLYPSGPWPASYHHTALLRPFNYNVFCIFNVLKFPVTQVPLGLNKEGLPLGIQVVASPGQDRLCLAMAQHLEQVFGGFVAPF